MECYRFAAERQLIFHVPVGGKSCLVQFGERNASGASHYITADENIADAIRLTSLFRRGAIIETTEKKFVSATASHTETLAPRHEDAVIKSKPTEAVGKSDEDVIEVKNFTQAKEIVIKRLGISKTAVKTPALLAQVAKKAGISIRYKED